MFFFFQAEDGIRDATVTGVQTCALPISPSYRRPSRRAAAPTHAAPLSGATPRTSLDYAGSPWNCLVWRVHRSEERRVGKEWRSRWGAEREKEKKRGRVGGSMVV